MKKRKRIYLCFAWVVLNQRGKIVIMCRFAASERTKRNTAARCGKGYFYKNSPFDARIVKQLFCPRVRKRV